ncbi:DUF2785 domain-containing protein [Virgibacillus halodenitrificans]|uniref:DUF2785 domain-containing protein n=1 Tax=Virgibacillus halodenitrificans TaxID=1482 RepID=UPI001FB28447|nr:DUF2785 domain-containing protein [Virgibacillus halodenitrificans]MCJ0932750.1 DUF2785 domain-containing protein [Virgibacillus halodenitrificans]
MQLKTVLQEITHHNDYDLSKISMDELIKEMLCNIGSTDPELRDALIHNAFGKLIQEDYLKVDQWRYIVKTCMDTNHLFLNIGETETDSVFSRSFSSLVLALILEKDSQEFRLSETEVREIIKQSILYLELERDIRGYVKDKGWAHSVAHGADLLAEAVKHPYFDMGLVDDCLKAVQHNLFKRNEEGIPYLDDEEERLVFVIEALLGRGATEDRIASWITEVSTNLNELLNREGTNLVFFRKRGEIVRFFRAIYFRCLFNKNFPIVQQELLKELKAWHEPFYD